MKKNEKKMKKTENRTRQVPGSQKNPKNYKKPVKSLRACIKLKKKELNK